MEVGNSGRVIERQRAEGSSEGINVECGGGQSFDVDLRSRKRSGCGVVTGAKTVDPSATQRCPISSVATTLRLPSHYPYTYD